MQPAGVLTRQRYKVVVLGAPSAGKTSLVRRLADGSFVEGARQRGLDFYTCHILLRDDTHVTLQLWDLSDCPSRPEEGHGPLSAYVYNSQAVLFVYDVSSPSSLETLRHALSVVEATSCAAGGARPYLALVSNKCDLLWTASEPLARELAARHGCARYTLSAKSGQGVSQTALQLACDLAGVPLTATDHHRRFGLDTPPIGPDGTGPVSLHAQELFMGLGARPPQAAAAVGPSQLPGPAEPCTAAAVVQPLAQVGGTFSARAPPYQAPQEPPMDSRRGSLDEVGRNARAGSSEAAWRPVSRTTTPSPTAMLISKVGPLGQRIHGRSTSPESAVSGPVNAGGAGATLGPLQAGAQPGDARRTRRAWRVLCCCG